MDLCGPIRVMRRGGKKFILVVDYDFPRYTWTIFFRTKNETVRQLIIFFKAIQSRLNYKIRSIKSDHGTKFENSQIEGFCLDHGINHYFSTPKTPQQSGVVERKNINLVEISRTM